MLRSPWLEKMLQVSLCLVAATIPFLFIANSISIILLTLLWLLQADFPATGRRLRRRPLLWAWIALFLLHGISYFYSEDSGQSLFDIQTKLSFLVMPVVIGAGMSLSRKTLEYVFLSFVAGLLLAASFAFLHTGYRYLHNGDGSMFFYHELLNGLDPNAVYMSWYVLLACCLLTFYPWTRFFQGRSAWLRYLLLLLLFIFLLFLASRTLIVFFFLFLPPVYLLRRRRLGWGHAVAGLLLAGTLLALATTNNPIRSRYADILQTSTSERVASHEFNNFTLRLFLWKTSLQMVREHNLWLAGCGNGDLHPMFNRQLDQAGIPDIYNPERRSHLYNVGVHNMYLHILCMIGLPGLLVFLAIMLGAFPRYAKAGILRVPALLFQFISTLFMLQESALQTHAGIIYFTFFSQIFLSWAYDRTEENQPSILASAS